MRVWDISIELREGVDVYPGDPEYSAKGHLTIEDDGCNVAVLSIGTHTGTHIDAPYHYFKYGKRAQKLPLELFLGKCRVSGNVEQCERLLLKGRTGISKAEACSVVQLGIKLIGIESMSIGDDEVHKLLLEREVVILENIDLSEVDTGEYILACQPLKINEDGSPVRACLIEVKNE